MKTDSLSKELNRENHRDSGMRSSSSTAGSDIETAPGAVAIGVTGTSTNEAYLDNSIARLGPEQPPASGLSHQMVVPEAELAPDLEEMVAMGVQKYIKHQTIQGVVSDGLPARKQPNGRLCKGWLFKAVVALFFLAVIAAATTAAVFLKKEEDKTGVLDTEDQQTPVPTGSSTIEITNSTTVELTNSTTDPVAPAGWITLGQDLYGKTWDDQYGSAVAASHDGQRIVACARWPEFFTRVYEFDTESWLWRQIGDELPYGASEGVAMDETGQRVAIGDYASGGARVFDWINSNWVEHAHVGAGLTGEPSFLGISLSMSMDGNRIALGDGPSQLAYVFERTKDGLSWVQIGDGLSGCMYSVRLSGDGRRAIVGGENAATVYEWNDVQWMQVGQSLSDEGAGGDYGSPIAISHNGNVVAVAATRANGGASANGIVRVYNWVDNNWLQFGGDIVGESPYDEFGTAVALSGNGTRIAIGAEYAEPGYVRVYEWNSLQWMKIGIEIKDSLYGYFGTAVDLSDDGEVVVAGDWSYNCEGGYCGFVRAFRFKQVD